MIITRSPLRLPLAGGGTDLESYYFSRGSSWISASINKFCYSIINKRFDKNFLIKYSKIEEVSSIDEIEHNLVRETLRFFEIKEPLELTFTADVPGSTGLGSSAAFLVSLIASLNSYFSLNLSNLDFSRISTTIEKDILNQPIGLQDQYISSLGGLKQFYVSPAGELSFENLPISQDNLQMIQNSLVLVYTGIKRDSNSILSEQVLRSNKNDSEVLNRLDYVKNQVPSIKKALLESDVNTLGNLFHEHWLLKSKQSPEMSSEYINDLYYKLIDCGAVGGKLIGAGGGGFLLFVVNDKAKFLNTVPLNKIEVVPFQFEGNGTTTIFDY
jgi:D-glycero-alpha-D-manno-heptose-7-phosphate kinase